MMNSKAKGEISEGAVLGRLLKLGKVVLIPFGNNQRYDLLIDEQDGTFTRVQVKTGQLFNGCVKFRSCSTNGFTGTHKNYKGQVDVFIVYCPALEKFYKVPVELAGDVEVRLRTDPPKGYRESIRWAKDYEL